jgi:predicted RNA binding protein YcfA (HicA-like mRNA interferase family)
MLYWERTSGQIEGANPPGKPVSMSPKLPRITDSQLLRALHRDGWYDTTQVGSHLTLRHPTKVGKVIVPEHGGHTIKLGTIASILDDAGLTADDLRRLI